MPVGNPFGACVSGRHWEHTHPRRLGTSAPADEKLAVRKSDIEVGNQGKMGLSGSITALKDTSGCCDRQ